jgi:hypothetical protein
MKRGKTKTSTSSPTELAPRYQLGLPGGSEFDALTTGFARAAGEARIRRLKAETNTLLHRAAHTGYAEAARKANLQLINDHAKSNGWMLADTKSGLVRSVTSKSLFDELGAEVNENFAKQGEVLTAETFGKGHAWKRVVRPEYKSEPLSGPFEKVFEQTVKLRDGLYLAHMPDNSINTNFLKVPSLNYMPGLDTMQRTPAKQRLSGALGSP